MPHDIIIIGAGPSGLCAAKTFLQHDPAADVVVLDARATAGGAWAREQLFPTLRTNNLWGSIDFTDLPMDPATFGVGPGQHVPGAVMHRYLAAYADRFDVARRIRLRTRVVEVRRRGRGDGAAAEGEGEGEGWAVRIEEAEGGEEDDDEGEEEEEEEEEEERNRTNKTSVLECRRLVVATGILSVPHMPALAGVDAFGAPVLHFSDVGRRAGRAVLADPAVRRVAVLGGGKSAYDAVYLAATTPTPAPETGDGRRRAVDWIIRRSGRGPAWVAPSHARLGPFRAWRERLALRRVVALMSPWALPDVSGLGWLRAFLHHHPVGRCVSRAFWRLLHRGSTRDCGYLADERTAALQPENNPMWYGTQAGILSFDTDFLALVRSGQVTVHRADVEGLSPRAVRLAGGARLAADALLCATGYSARPTVAFAPASLRADLGVPTAAASPGAKGGEEEHQRARWARLDRAADAAIAARLPALLAGPTPPPHAAGLRARDRGANADVPYTPWRLYRAIAPPGLAARGDRSLVFIGMFSNVANTTRLEIQCLWALAYMTGKLALPEDPDEVFASTALLQRYTEHRSPHGHGRVMPDLVMDQLPYWDLLLNDLGLETRRKGGLRELFEPYTQDDYRGLVDEWLAKNT